MSEFTRRRYFGLICALIFISTTCAPRLDAAEMRTWSAAAGGFTVEAELIALKAGDIAQLKTKDGRTIEVPLAQLSAADQAYARNPNGAATNTSPKTAVVAPSGSAKVDEVQKQADRCRTPDEALILFKVFHDDAATSPADKQLALARIAEYKQLAADKKVRVNKQWVSAEEAAAVRKKADELMRQGLELWKLDQEDAARKKFSEAAAIEPEEIRADFILGFIFLVNRMTDKALPIFQRCLQRDPENIAVLNNIALLAAARGDWPAMTGNWRKAISKHPDQRIVHNIGRFLSQASQSNVAVPKGPRDTLALPYAELVASGKFKATDPEVGWLVLMIEESALDFSLKDDDAKAEKKNAAVPAANEDGIVVGGGTGFVVHPGYVLTNAHVAMDDSVFEIQTHDGKRLRGTRVAKATGADLALIKCEELTAPPVVLCKDLAPRGTDVMVLGFPEFYSLGATLKATRGSISSLPDPQANDMYLYDAVTNSGNSGGPVCDASGNIVAVHCAGINTASRYGCGIPAATARKFLAQSLPADAQQASPSTEKLDWPAVDAKVSPSTVLIWVRRKNAPAATSQIGSDVLELPICLFCGGTKGARCTVPGCAKARASGRGRSCPECRGTGIAACQVCDGLGIDATLASVQEAVAKAKAAKSGGGSSTPSSSSTAASGTASNAATDDSITADRLSRYRKDAKPGDPNSLKDDIRDTVYNYNGSEVQPQTNQLSQYDLDRIASALTGGDRKQVDDAAVQLTASVVVPQQRERIALLLERWISDEMKQYWWTRAQVCRALGVWGREESKPMIHKLLRDPSWVTRRQAAITCGHTGDVSAVPQLVDCLIRPDAFEGDHSEGKFNFHNERGRFLRAIIVIGPGAIPELQRVRPNQNVKVQEMLDFIIAACRE